MKELIEAGVTLSLPYKEEIDEWFGDIKLTKLKNNKYVMQVQGSWDIYEDVDEAIRIFKEKGFNSFGYMMSQYNHEHPEFDLDELDESEYPAMAQTIRDWFAQN